MTSTPVLNVEHVAAAETNKYLRINTGFDTFDNALFAKLDVDCTAGGNVSVTAANLKANGLLNLTGTPAGAFNLDLGAVNRDVLIYNGSGQTATVRAGTFATTATLATGSMGLFRIQTNAVYSVSGGGGGATATPTEQLTGTDTSKSSTPDSVAALWEKGSGVAYAATLSLGEGGLFHITAGSGPVTDIDFATAKDGRHALLIFDVAVTFTHGANLVCPGGVDATFAADEMALVYQDNGDKVYVRPLKARKPKYMGSFGGAPGASVVVFAFMVNEAVSFAASLAGSVVKAKTAATAQTDFDVQKNGVSVGTIRFAAAGTVATYVSISAFTMASGDYLEIVSPGSPDATLANIFFTLQATGEVY